MEKVRWNAEEKGETVLLNYFSKCFEFVPVCPEVEMGTVVPREPVQLVEDTNEQKMQGAETAKDGPEVGFSEPKV